MLFILPNLHKLVTYVMLSQLNCLKLNCLRLRDFQARAHAVPVFGTRGNFDV